MAQMTNGEWEQQKGEWVDEFWGKFPRRVPEGTVLLDENPPGRLDAIRHVVDDVQEQLSLAEAPVTGRNTACVLVADDRGYGGHVVERSATDTVGAFDMAMDQVPSGGISIYGAVVAGSGAVKEKHLLPSSRTLDRLQSLTVANAHIVVVQPGQWHLGRTITLPTLRKAYEPKVESVFTGLTRADIQKEAEHKTHLSNEDRRFVADLRLAGLDEDIHYFLTGSGSARGGPSVALRKRRYNDLDIIAASALSSEEIEASFECVAESHYGLLEKKPKSPRVAGSDRFLAGWLYRNENVEIDFFPTERLEDAFVRSEYLENNLFHKLS